jgi:hypothetical protein
VFYGKPWPIIPEAEQDSAALKLVIGKRRDKMRNYFDSLAGKFGRAYLPGRSWEGLAEVLLRLMPPLVIADLGAGEGTFSQLLALRANTSSPSTIPKRWSSLAASWRTRTACAIWNLGSAIWKPCRLQRAVDVAFFSQSLHHAIHPNKAVDEALVLLC